MATVLPASSGTFGLTGFTTATAQSRSVSAKMDKKTAKGTEGAEIAVAFHGYMAEHSIELLDTSAIAAYVLGAVATAPDEFAAAIAGNVFVVDEISVEMSNEDFVKGTVKVSEYKIQD